MLFCKGVVSSVVLMIKALKSFPQASGIHVNTDKTYVYFGNVKKNIQHRVLQVTGFTKGTFPFSYLSVTIYARRLTIADCNILVDRIVKRIMCWSSRHLSYAARSVLVQVVLMSIHT